MFSSIVGLQTDCKTLSKNEIAPEEGYGYCLVVCHFSFLNFNETIMRVKYCQQIDEMNQILQRICLSLVNRKGRTLHHDNARPHVAQLTLQKLEELGYESLPHLS